MDANGTTTLATLPQPSLTFLYRIRVRCGQRWPVNALGNVIDLWSARIPTNSEWTMHITIIGTQFRFQLHGLVWIRQSDYLNQRCARRTKGGRWRSEGLITRLSKELMQNNGQTNSFDAFRNLIFAFISQ